jgi:hypothetical protein
MSRASTGLTAWVLREPDHFSTTRTYEPTGPSHRSRRGWCGWPAVLGGRPCVVVGRGPHPPRRAAGGRLRLHPGRCVAPAGNPSATEQAVAVVARTDPNEQESVVRLPHLDDVPEMS